MTNLLGLDSSAWLALTWRVAWQSTAILAAGLIATKLVAMRPSRAHRILLASALACLLVQPAAFVARRLDFGLISSAPGPMSTEPVESIALESAAVPDPRSSPIPSERPRPVHNPAGRGRIDQAARTAKFASVDDRGTEDAAADRDPTSVVFAIPLVWAALALAGLLRILSSFFLGSRLKSRALVLTDPEFLAAAEEASRCLGLSTPPEVRTSRSVRCPVVWCWGSCPVLILPEAVTVAGSGSRSDWLAILCHELAHWKRADHLSALATEFLTSLVPWQPLAWVLRSRLTDLSELACDDWALAHARAVSPPDYVEALLGLAVDRRRPLVPAAISRRSGLGVRVLHILDATEPMPRAGVLWSAVIVGLWLGFVTMLALAQPRQARAVLAVPPATEEAGKPAVGPNLTTVEGTVRGRNAELLPGVEVLWVGVEVGALSHVAMPHDHPDLGKRRMKVLTRALTDGQGRFSLQARVDKPASNGPWTMVVAHKQGLAPGSLPVALDGKPLDVVLEAPVPIKGRILSPGGDPVAGVGMRLQGYSNARWQEIGSQPMMQFGEDEMWDSRPAFYPAEFRTDDTGRFVIDDFVPAGMFAELVLTHPEYAVEDLTVSTGESTEPPPELAAFGIRPLAREFSHTLTPARPVVGRITDAETKEPLAGMTVKVSPMRRHGGRPIRTVTDRDGRYRVADREGDDYGVVAYPPSGSGYLPAERRSIKWPAGGAELHVDLAVRRGVVLRGRVVDEVTGTPLPGVAVVYQPTHGNARARGNSDLRSPALTGADGRFTLTGVRGPGVVVAEAPSELYIRRAVAPVDFGHNSGLQVHGLARFEVPAEGDAPGLVIKLKKGFTFEARVVRPDGSAVDMVRAWCPELTARLLENWVSPGEFPDGVFRLPGAEPGRTYRVFFLEHGEKYGRVAELKADPQRTDPIEVRLESTASFRGRVLDVDGMPIEGAQILPNIQLVDKGSDLSERDRFDGFVTQLYLQFTNEPLKQVYPAEFHYKGLIPGVRYFVSWYTTEGGHDWRAVEALRAGEERDLGDLRSEKKKGGKDGN